jgi:alkane 1-monooxygenase
MPPITYLLTFSLPLTMALALSWQGGWSFLPLGYAFGLIPALELMLRPDSRNLSRVEEDLRREHPLYDWLIYLTVPVQGLAVGSFLWVVSRPGLALYEQIGLITAMGVMCGTFGINVGHELGHRRSRHERILAKIALMTSLYMHFYIEHNRGHHKHVSTDQDPASARYGETVYAFWLRAIVGGYRSAWRLERERLARKGLPILSWANEMLRFHLIQGSWLLGIGFLFGGQALLMYSLAALMGILLLETVNYIEHYGLRRQALPNGHYERVAPQHSWNSDHVLGRLLLFELSRHSDHHYLASRPYQVLRHHEQAPQMPTGYPGMMLLSLLPPLWFAVMHRRLAETSKAMG